MTALEEIKKALAAAEQFIVNGVELGYIRMPDPEIPDSAHDTLPMIRQAQTTLESLQRENEEKSAWIKAATTEITKAIGGGSEMFTPHGDEFRVDPAFVASFIQNRRDRHAESKKASIQKERELLARAEAAEAEVKRLRDRYECWMPVTETPPAGMHPDALLHFHCISDEVDGEESPEYWKTDTWQDKPADAVYWCAIVSPLGPHERTFIARTALASTGGEHHAE